MPIDRFIKERKTIWQRLEELLELLDRMTLRRLHREEVRELGRIYRRTASDLAIARAESRDPRLVNYLNSLVIRAHGRIYGQIRRVAPRIALLCPRLSAVLSPHLALYGGLVRGRSGVRLDRLFWHAPRSGVFRVRGSQSVLPRDGNQ